MKEIAELPGISPRAVEFHRYNIRKKLGLDHGKTNPRSYLLSIDQEPKKLIQQDIQFSRPPPANTAWRNIKQNCTFPPVTKHRKGFSGMLRYRKEEIKFVHRSTRPEILCYIRARGIASAGDKRKIPVPFPRQCWENSPRDGE
jgi:hypothetical protein